MKIAIPTNDKENIHERTGRASGFLVLELDNNKILEKTYRKNPHTHDHDQAHSHEKHSHDDLISAIDDCELIIVYGIGKHLVNDLEKAGIAYQKTKEKVIQKELESRGIQ